MASTSDCCFHTIFRFTVDVTNFVSNSIESPEIKLSDINWKFKLEKASIEGNNNNILGVYLVSQFGDNTKNWSCLAQATFKLLPKDADKMEQSVVKYLPKQKFSNVKRSHGINEFVQWNDFLEHFVNDENKAIFEVEISTEPSNRASELGIDQKYTKFRIVVENVDKLGNCFSSENLLRGIKWKVKVKKEGNKLAIYLFGDENDMDMNWCYEVEATFQLLSFNENTEPRKMPILNKFRRGMSNWGYAEFFGWDDFMNADKKYVQDNTAIVVVELKVNDPEPLWKIAEYKLSKENSLLLCTICLECFTSGKIFSIKCGHLFCKPCFDKIIEKRQACPNCNAATSANDLRPIFFA